MQIICTSLPTDNPARTCEIARLKKTQTQFLKVTKYPQSDYYTQEHGPMPNVMAALPNIGGALWSTPQSLADAQYWSAMQ